MEVNEHYDIDNIYMCKLMLLVQFFTACGIHVIGIHLSFIQGQLQVLSIIATSLTNHNQDNHNENYPTLNILPPQPVFKLCGCAPEILRILVEIFYIIVQNLMSLIMSLVTQERRRDLFYYKGDPNFLLFG